MLQYKLPFDAVAARALLEAQWNAISPDWNTPRMRIYIMSEVTGLRRALSQAIFDLNLEREVTSRVEEKFKCGS